MAQGRKDDGVGLDIARDRLEAAVLFSVVGHLPSASAIVIYSP